MKLSKVFSQALFKTPRYNAFPQSNEVKFSCPIGKLIPVQRWLMNPGDSIDVNLQQLIRFAPLSAPIMHRFSVDFQAIEIPDRLAIPATSRLGQSVYPEGYLDGGFENFHNLDNTLGTPPYVYIGQLASWYTAVGLNPIGSLFDFLGYPVFSDLYTILSDNGIFDGLLTHGIGSDSPSPGQAKADPAEYYPFPEDYITDGELFQMFPVSYHSVDLNDSAILSFTQWMLSNYSDAFKFVSPRSRTYGSFMDYYGISYTDETALNATQIEALNVKMAETIGMPMDDLVRQYTDFVFLLYLGNYAYSFNSDPRLGLKLSLVPLYAFWSAYYDWFINTNIQGNIEDSKQLWLVQLGLNLDPKNYSTYYGWLASDDNDTPSDIKVGQLPSRLWADDYFTSAFTSPAAGGNVMIPANGTIVDLRNANSLQKLREKLMYSGKRYIDQVLAIFGVHSSNERLDRCRVLGTAHFNVNVSDVTQTSQDTEQSRLGDYAGQAITVGQNGSFIHYQAEEHSTIMVFMSVRPVAIYQEAIPRDLLKISPYDYLIPELAQVGEQPIYEDELLPSCDANAEQNVFGFQRRYAEYMFTPSHIHGEFRTSLRFWHASREFSDTPSLNEDFISITPSDGYDRIFAVLNQTEQLRCFLYFDTVISRPLSKFIEYHL